MYIDPTLVFGILAIICALLNVVFTLTGRDSRFFMFASLSFTALTLYVSRGNDLRIVENIGMDEDLMFTPLLLVPTLASILINSIGLFGKKK